MVSVDLLFCHEVFDAVSHSVGIAIASVTLFFISLVFTVSGLTGCFRLIKWSLSLVSLVVFC